MSAQVPRRLRRPDFHVERPLRRRDLLDELRQRDGAHGSFRLGAERRDLAKDLATALHLLAQEPDVFRKMAVVTDFPLHLLGDECDGGQGRSEFMGSGRRKSVKLAQVLFAARASSVAASASPIRRDSSETRQAKTPMKHSASEIADQMPSR